MNTRLMVAVAAALVLSSCHNSGHVQQAQEEGHNHSHEERLMVTAYSSTIELFAECTPVVAGEETEILAHLTVLEDFAPVTNEQVTATLTAGGSKVSAQAECVADGKYEFHLTPAKAGNGQLEINVPGLGVVKADVKVCADDGEADEEIEESEPESSNGVAFSKEKAWAVGMQTAEIQRMDIGSVIRTMASVELPAESRQSVVAASSGRVGFALRDLVPGIQVSKGQVLFTIEGNGTSDDNLAVKFADAQADYNLAKSEYERKCELAEYGIVSRSELEQAKADYEKSKAAYENLSSNWQDGRQVIKAAIDGYLESVDISAGQHIEAGQQLATISDLSEIHLHADVQSRYYSQLAHITGANIKRIDSSRTFSLEEACGKLVSYGRSTHGTSSLIPVTFCLSNDMGLVPGAFVEMFISTGVTEPVTCVPVESIVEEMGQKFVFVQLNPEFFEKRPVVTGQSNGMMVQILQGVSEGERVVSGGAMFVKLSQSQGALDPHAGHNH